MILLHTQNAAVWHLVKRAQTGLSLRLRTLFGSILHADGGYADFAAIRCSFTNGCF
jgi:hypothetical protein